MLPIFRIYLILILLAATQLHGEAIYAKPKQDFQVGYPIEARTLKIYPLTKIELHRQTNDAVFVSIEGDPIIIKLDRHGSDKRPLFELHGDQLKPLEMLHKKVDQGWMLFSQSTAYEVVEIDGGQLTLRFPRGDGLINLKLSADYFDLHTKEAIAQTIKRAKAEAEQPRLAQTTTRDRPFNRDSNSPQIISPEQRNHQTAENSLKAYLANQPVPFRITTEPTEAACIVENVRDLAPGSWPSRTAASTCLRTFTC